MVLPPLDYPRNRVTLNSKNYAIIGGAQTEQATEFAPQFTIGEETYSRRENVSQLVMSSWTGGIGIRRAPSAEALGRYFYGETIDGRFANQLILGPLVANASTSLTTGSNNTTTTPASYVYFNGKEYFAVRDKVWSWVVATTTLAEVLDVGTSTVNSLSVFVNSSGVAQIYAFLTSGAFYFSDTGDSADWTQGTSTLGLTGLQYDTHFIIAGGTDTAYQIDTADTADGSLASYTTLFLTGNATSIASAPRRMILFRNAQGEIVPYVMLAFGTGTSAFGQLYVMDYYARTLRPLNVAPVQLGFNDSTWATVWNDALYYADVRGHVYKYDVTTYQDVGLTTDQGPAVITLSQGSYVHHLTSTPRFLYFMATSSDVVVGGGADIFSHNGIGNHPIAGTVGGDRGMFRSEVTPGRIYYVTSNNASGGTAHQLGYFTEAVAGNPINDSSYTYATGGYIITPWYDLGFANLDKTLLRLTIDGENLTADEKVTVTYQINNTGADDFTTGATALTAFTATNTSVSFGSGAGIAARQVRFKIALARGGTTTLTPIVRALVLDFQVRPDYRAVKTFTVSVDETIALRGAPEISASDLVGELKTAFNTDTLLDFQHGDDTAIKVQVVSWPYVLYDEEDNTRDGTIQVQVLEPIAS